MKRRKTAVAFLSLILTFSFLPESKALTQVAIACMSVNNWPIDYTSVWTTAIKKHNASPNTITAASYMISYIEMQKLAFKIKDSNAITIYNSYEHYWTLLEQDLIKNAGKVPPYAVSIKYLAPLMKKCAKYR